MNYPLHDKTITVTACRRIYFDRRKINLSQVFAGQKVGLKQVSDRIWLVTLIDEDLRYFDDAECRIEPLESPFGPKLLRMSPEWSNTVITRLPQAFVGECMARSRFQIALKGVRFGPVRKCNIGC